MNYYDDLLGLKPSLLEPIKPDKHVKIENMPMPFKPKKLVKWQEMPINKGMKGMKPYNYNPKEKMMEIMKRMEKNQNKLNEDFPELFKAVQVSPLDEYVVGNICNYIKSKRSNLESPDVKERIKEISEKYKN